MSKAVHLSLFLAASFLWSLNLSAQPDISPHKVQFVMVEEGVRLEVLDWGGLGRPLIFLAGNGDTAHAFDNFAPKFTGQNHVYGITRKGFGASSKPAPTNGNYSADRLGDDVLAVMQALRIERPVLVGHSLAGEELSSIGSRFPNKVSGLIYLDAAASWAFYDPAHPQVEIEMNGIRKRIEEIEAGGVDEQEKLRELEIAIARFETVLHQSNEDVKTMPPLPPRSTSARRSTHPSPFRSSQSLPALTIGAASFPTTRDAEQRDLPRIQRAARREPNLSHEEFQPLASFAFRTQTITSTARMNRK
jgi:non-heme chloroperoxidase